MAFGAMLLRDITVLRKEFVQFLARTVMQPLLFVFVELTVSEVPAPVLFRSALGSAAVFAAPLPPTAVPAGGWNEPRNCWIEAGMSPFG